MTNIYKGLPTRRRQKSTGIDTLRNYVTVTLSIHVRPLPFFVHVTYVRGSVLRWRHRYKLRTSGFMDDVIHAHKPRQLNVAACSLRNSPG